MFEQGLRRKRRFDFTLYFGIALALLFSYLAMQSYSKLALHSIHFEMILSLFGFICLFCNGFKIIKKSPDIIKLSFFSSFIKTVLIQIFLIIITLVFFYFLVYQNRMGLPSKPLTNSKFIDIIKENYLTLGFFPWLIYTVIGVSLAYFAFNFDRAGSLDLVLFHSSDKYPFRFYRDVFFGILRVGVQNLILLLASFTLIWLCETLSVTLNYPSLFQFPINFIFIFILATLLLRVQNKKLLNSMKSLNLSLGKMIILYILCYSFYIVLIQFTIKYFEFGKQIFSSPGLGINNSILDTFSNEVETLRLTLIIWGWWSLFVPLMASLIARFYIGKTIFEALFCTLFFPVILFLFIVPNMNSALIDLFFYPPSLAMHWIILFIFFFTILLFWRNTYHLGDILRIAMPDHPLIKKRPFNKWVNVLFICLNGFTYGLFALGWLQVQLLLTLSAFGMLLFIFGYTVFLLINFVEDFRYKKINFKDKENLTASYPPMVGQ